MEGRIEQRGAEPGGGFFGKRKSGNRLGVPPDDVRKAQQSVEYRAPGLAAEAARADRPGLRRSRALRHELAAFRPRLLRAPGFAFGASEGVEPLQQIVAILVAHVGIADRGDVVEEAALEAGRSEEHTSELQSLMRHLYAGFFLTKKKTHI